jgi:DNA-directed RNA polymerase specialized sigma24 family protein
MDNNSQPSREPQSITLWFDQLKRGNQDAAKQLWDRLFERLVVYARKQMQGLNRRVADEEDIAIGVMSALCGAADRNELPSIHNREDLWRMLLCWTRHDILDQRRYQERQKRGGTCHETIHTYDESNNNPLDQLVSSTPPSDVLQEMGEQYAALLQRLPDERLRNIAIAKMHGHSHEEIAVQLSVSVRTIERKLNLIRGYWSQ